MHIPFHCYERTFEFCVGSSRYPCCHFIADFLSPRVARFREDDPSVDCYAVSVADNDGLFGSLIRMAEGGSATIHRGQEQFFLCVAEELENAELYQMIIHHFGLKVTIDNCVSRMRARRVLGLDYEEESRFIAANLFDIPESDRDSLILEELHSVLSHPLLRLSTEEALFELIARKSDIDPVYFALFEHVQFDLLESELLFTFVELATRHLQHMSVAVWRQISTRLVLPVNLNWNGQSATRAESPGRSSETTYPFVADNPLDGIIAELNRRRDPFSAQGELFRVIYRSQIGSLYSPENIARLAENSDYCSENLPGQYIGYDFFGMPVTLTHYTIRTGFEQTNPESWVFEMSPDGGMWIEADRQESGGLADRSCFVRTYPLRTPATGAMCRLRQTAPNCAGSDFLCLSSLEVFGTISGKPMAFFPLVDL
jgi:hypothetical protein